MPGTAALLTGLNYIFDPVNRLRGCCNDVRAVSKYLATAIPDAKCQVITDENPKTVQGTMFRGMLRSLNELCVASWRDDLDVAIVQYSGHGTQMKDSSGDEPDGLDEVIVPNDARVMGCISDDDLLEGLKHFNPRTLIFCVFDCCHSGSVLDLPHTVMPGQELPAACGAHPAGQPRIVCLSGCRDDQVSMDAPDADAREHRGALTACMLRALTAQPLVSALELQRRLAQDLVARGFKQVPVLSCNFDVTNVSWFRSADPQ